MKVLQIDVSVNIGSTGRIAELIGENILSKGYSSYIAYGRYSKPSASKVIKIGSKVGQLYHLFLTRVLDRHGFGSRQDTNVFIEKIKELKPDIIHLHQIHGYYINIEALFKFLSDYGKPVIWTLHDCWAYTGHCPHYSRVSCEKWKTECQKCPLKDSYPETWFFDNSKINFNLKRKLFNNIENLTLVPVSHWLGNELKSSFLKSNKINTICNGIDTENFKFSDPTELRVKHNLQGKRILLGVASPWSAVKGLDDFIALSKITSGEIVIVLIGLNQKQIQSLPNNVIGIERLENPSDLAKYYSLADIFINPSKAESFGLVTVEAMACGTPVIGYNTTATPELIKEGTGYVVEKSNLSELLISIHKVLLRGRDAFSIACRKNVIDNYNKDIQYAKYVDLFEELLNEVKV